MPHDKANFSSNRYNRRALRRDLRSNGTSAEAALWSCLRAKQVEGIQWRRQFSIGPFILDFYAPRLKLCIELDGEPHCTPEGHEHDIQREEWLLREHGIHTIRFENSDVFRHNESVVEYIRKITKEILNSFITNENKQHHPNSPSVYRGSTAEPGGSSKRSAEKEQM